MASSNARPEPPGPHRWGLALLEQLANAEEKVGRHLQQDAASVGVENLEDAKAWLSRLNPEHLAKLFQAQWPELPLEKVAQAESRGMALRLLALYPEHGLAPVGDGISRIDN